MHLAVIHRLQKYISALARSPTSLERARTSSSRKDISISRTEESGFSLLMALSVVGLLTLGAATLFQQASADLLTASGTQVQTRGRILAELGSQWGQSRLISIIYNGGVSTSPSPASLSNLPQVTNGDALCQDGVDCTQFYLLSGSDWITVANGKYRVAVSCQPQGCSNASASSLTYYLRVQAVLTNGRSTVVETVLGYAS